MGYTKHAIKLQVLFQKTNNIDFNDWYFYSLLVILNNWEV